MSLKDKFAYLFFASVALCLSDILIEWIVLDRLPGIVFKILLALMLFSVIALIAVAFWEDYKK